MKSLSLIAPINNTGFGRASISILRALMRKSNVSLFPIGGMEVGTEEEAKYVRAALDNAKFPSFDSPALRIWHQHDMSQFVGKGPHIGFPFFELDKFTEQEKYHLNSLDLILTPSEWSKTVILENLGYDTNVEICPLGVENYSIRAQHNNSSLTKFFCCGKWEKRKGHDKVIEAFCKVFSDDDDVLLYMMCHNPFLNIRQEKEWKDLYINSPLGHKVRFLPRVQSHREVIETMGKMDCGVFVSRAEGWNLELLEMMSIGKPVIATNYSAHTEFCNKENSMLVEIDSLEMADDGVWFDGKVGRWAELGYKQVDSISEYMRHVHMNKQVNLAGIETGKKYTWENTATEILKYV
jgi:glycosyltransferase involved in cell wall biosynthesis